MTTPHINTLRTELLATLVDLRNRDAPMEPDRARAIAQVASVLVDSAKVEVDYVKATNLDSSDFLEPRATKPPALTNETPSANNPFPNVVRHRLQG